MLWNFVPFPEWLLDTGGLHWLPVLAILMYFYVPYAIYRMPSERWLIAGYCVLTILSALAMLYVFRTHDMGMWPFLAWLMVMLYPSVISIMRFYQRKPVIFRRWAVITISGFVYSYAWYIWLYALANS